MNVLELRGPQGTRPKGPLPGRVIDMLGAVCTVSVLVALLPPGVTETGEKVAVAPVGSPLAERLTGSLKLPFTDVTIIVYCTLPPAFTV